MTLSNEEYPQRFVLSGTGQRLPFRFYVEDSSWILVTQYRDGTRTDLTLTTDYTVEVEEHGHGGTVVMNSDKGEESDLIVVSLNVPVTQLYEFRWKTAFSSANFGSAMDKIGQICRQLQGQVDRALKVPLVEAYTGVGLRRRKGKLLRVNDDGEVIPEHPEVLLGAEINDWNLPVTGEIAVSYSSEVTLTPISACKANMAIEIYLFFNPDEGSPSDDQKTLWITLVDSSTPSRGGGFVIGASEWTTVRTGALKAAKNLDIDFLPSTILDANATLWEEDDMLGYTTERADVSLEHIISVPTGLRIRARETAGPNFFLEAYDAYTGTILLASVNIPNAAPVDYYIDLPGLGLDTCFPILRFHYNSFVGPEYSTIEYPPPACGLTPPINYGVFISSPFLTDYAAAHSGAALAEVETTGLQGYEVTPTIADG